MDPKERYYWDLTGYLVIRNVLSEAEIREVNRALDHVIQSGNVPTGGRSAGDSRSLQGTGARWAMNTNLLELPEPHGQLICNLMVHPEVVYRLNHLAGRGWRLDHGPQFNNAVKGTVGLQMHGRGEPHTEATGYLSQNRALYCGGITATWNLTDCPEGGGGFACSPGSHKSRYPMPDGVRTCDDDGGSVIQPAFRAGDVLLFMDGAQTHGTHPWQNDHDRRSLLFKYASRTSTRSGPSREVYLPEIYWDREVCEGMTSEQRAVMHGPGSSLGRDRALALVVDENGSVRTELPEGQVQIPVGPDPEEGGALTPVLRVATAR